MSNEKPIWRLLSDNPNAKPRYEYEVVMPDLMTGRISDKINMSEGWYCNLEENKDEQK